MYILLLGIFIFFGVHLVPSFVDFRLKLISKLGEGPYKGLYSLLALVGLILIIYGKSIAEFQVIWEPPVWSRDAIIVIMIASFFSLVAADMKSNVKRFVKHPMLVGIALWSGSHLFANGDGASILLFGSFLIFSILDMFLANKRGAARQEKKFPIKKDVTIIIIGLIFYFIFIKYLHPWLIGVTII